MESSFSVSLDSQQLIIESNCAMESLAKRLILRGIIQPDAFANCDFLNLTEECYVQESRN